MIGTVHVSVLQVFWILQMPSQSQSSLAKYPVCLCRAPLQLPAGTGGVLLPPRDCCAGTMTLQELWNEGGCFFLLETLNLNKGTVPSGLWSRPAEPC